MVGKRGLLLLFLIVVPFVCADCGNELCEPQENPTICPEDCSIQSGFVAMHLEPEIASETPMKWSRLTKLQWGDHEPSPGVFDFEFLDKYVDALGPDMTTVFVIITGNKDQDGNTDPDWPLIEDCDQNSCKLQDTTEAKLAWKNFLKGFFVHFSDKNVMFQIGNEYANRNTLFSGTADDYIEILRLAHEARTEAGTDTKLIMTKKVILNRLPVLNGQAPFIIQKICLNGGLTMFLDQSMVVALILMMDALKPATKGIRSLIRQPRSLKENKVWILSSILSHSKNRV